MSETVGIKLVSRVRSLNEDEAGGKGSAIACKVKGDSILLNAGGKSQSFSLDSCHDHTIRLDQIYKQNIESFVLRSLNGNNVTLIGLGTTGSGHSELLSGTGQEAGIGPCVIHTLFRSIEEQKINKIFFLTVQCLEIKDDKFTDVLNPHSKPMTIKEHPHLGIYVEGLSELVAHSSNDLSRLYDQCNRARNISSVRGTESTYIFYINIEQKEHKSGKVGLKSTLALVDLEPVEGLSKNVSNQTKSLSTLKAVLDAVKSGGNIPYRNTKLTRLLQESIGGCSATMVLLSLSPTEAQQNNSLISLQTAQMFRSIKNKVTVRLGETNNLISELRDEISNVRNKIVRESNHDKDDVMKLKGLINDLDIVKLQTWEEKERLSQQYESERKINLANKGILEWVLDSNKTADNESQQQIVLIQKEKDQVTMEYRQLKEKSDQLKAELSKKITEYSKMAESDKASESQIKSQVSSIHEKKGQLRQETERLEKLKQQLKSLQEKQRESKKSNQDLMFLKGNAELRRKYQADEFKKLELEHRGMIEEENERCNLEIEQQKADIQLRTSQGHQYSSSDVENIEVKSAKLQAERSVIALQIQSLKDEKDKLLSDLEGTWKIHKDELEMQQLQHFQTFKQYREMFEVQKSLIENRYRGLLEESLHDAIYMSTRQNDLVAENDMLKQEIAELKDKVSSAKYDIK